MDYAIKLVHLPGAVAFPERLKERVRYDADRGELIYRGFMTKCMYDELSALSDDAEYHRALERLFVLTSADAVQTPSRRLPTAAIAATIGAVAVAAGAFWFSTRQASVDNAAPQSESVVAAAAAR